MSSIAFGSTYSFLTSATPSTGWVIGFDTDGVLKQKDSLGNIILIGGGPTAGNLGTYSISQVLTVGNNTGTRSIIMGTATNIKSVNGGGKIELDRLSGTNSVLISSDNSSQLESYLILKNDSAKFAFNSSKQMIDLDGNGNQISIYNNNAGSISLGVDTGSLIYGQLDEIKITYNATATASTGNYDKNAVLIGTKNSKIGNGVVNTVVLGGVGFTASNSNSVYVPDVYLQNQKGVKSIDSNEVFYLNDSNGYTLLDRNSGNLDSSWLLMATDYQSTYQSYIEIGVNSDPGYGNDSLIYISNNKGPSYSYDDYSTVSLGKNILRFSSKDVDGTGDVLRINMSAVNNNMLVDGPTASFKGIEYNEDFSLNFVTHSLVDKQYVDSQFTGFTLDVILTAGNNSESNDIVMGTATVISSANGGGQIDLDYVGITNEVFISTDNGTGAESYVSLSPTDAIVESVGSVTINGNEVKVSTNDLEGIKYLGNYESNFVTQSLVNKGYVDSGTSSIWTAIDSINLDYISEIITGPGLTGGGTYGVLNIDVEIGNGLQFVTNSIYIGGTLSQDTLIDGGLYNFDLTNATNISLSASGVINNFATDLSGYYGQSYLDSNVVNLKVGFASDYGVDVMTQSGVTIQNHRVSLESFNSNTVVSSINVLSNPTTISDGSTDNRLIVMDDEFNKGLVYKDDYSSNFSTYSLVTKGYVDEKQQYVNNGLTFSSGYIGLGGTLSGPVFIEGYDNNVYFNDFNRFSVTASAFIVNTVFSLSTNTSVQYNDGDNYYTRVDDASGTYSFVDITPGLLQMGSGDPLIGNAGINFYSQDQVSLDGSTNNRIVVADDISQKGIVYKDDYTANFTTYSLVTKGYVDSVVSSVGATNGLVELSNGVIGLGGTLSTSTNINGEDLYDLNFESMNRILMTASTYIDSAIYSNNFIFRNYLGSSDAQMIATDVITSTYSRVYLDYNSVNLESNDSLASVVISVLNKDTLISDGSTNNRLVVNDSANHKGLVYNSDYSPNFTTYSLVTKGYVDSTVVNLSLSIGTTSIISGTNFGVLFQSGGVVQQDGSFIYNDSQKRLTLPALEILSQTSSSSYTSLRVRNYNNTSDFISILGDGNINVGTSTAATVSSTFNVYSGFSGGNYLKLINDTSNFDTYQGIDMAHTGRPGYFALETAGNQGSSITRFRGGGSTNANAKITAYIDHPGDVDKTGHWHFRTQVHLGDAYRSFDSSYGRHTLVIENGVGPTASPTNSFIQYSADITSGNAAPHFRTENGSIVKIYQETTGVSSATFSSIGGPGSTALNDLDTYDGYTLQQVVRALRNLGLLA